MKISRDELTVRLRTAIESYCQIKNIDVDYDALINILEFQNAKVHFVGMQLKEKREAIFLSLTKLSKIIGISAASLSEIETGTHQPGKITASKIQEFLNGDFDHLIPMDKDSLRKRKIDFSRGGFR